MISTGAKAFGVGWLSARVFYFLSAGRFVLPFVTTTFGTISLDRAEQVIGKKRVPELFKDKI